MSDLDTRIGAEMNVSVGGPGYSFGPQGKTAAETLHPNISAFPGQVFVTPPRMSAKKEGKYVRSTAVQQARQAERTSEHIRGGIDRKVDMVVGATLRVIPRPDWDLLGLNEGEDGWKSMKPFAKACAREFQNWANDSRCLCDAEGHYNFNGLMWMAYRNLVGPDAETAGIIHYDEERMAKYNARWATFVTILDPDRIETPSQGVGRDDIHEGIHMDEHGRRIGMFVRKGHPTDDATLKDPWPQHDYVPRETWWGRAMSFHFFKKTRGGQVRGVTTLVNSLKQTGMLDQFDDAYLGSQVIAQALSVYIETLASAETVAQQMAPGPREGPSPWNTKLDYYGGAKMSIGPQRIPVMPPGDKIHMDSVARTIADPTAFRNNFLRQFASALGISFEQISNNYSDANYSAARAALLEIWRGISTERKMFTAHVATLIYAAVIEEAIYRGRITLPPGAPPFQENRGAYTACAWAGPGMGWIDPQKEANAFEKLLAMKVTTREEIVAERNGGDYEDIFDQIELEYAEAEERGFDLEVVATGAQAVDEDPDDEDVKPKPKPKAKAPATSSQE